MNDNKGDHNKDNEDSNEDNEDNMTKIGADSCTRTNKQTDRYRAYWAPYVELL
jgi:hypothetical protein